MTPLAAIMGTLMFGRGLVMPKKGAGLKGRGWTLARAIPKSCPTLGLVVQPGGERTGNLLSSALQKGVSETKSKVTQPGYLGACLDHCEERWLH